MDASSYSNRSKLAWRTLIIIFIILFTLYPTGNARADIGPKPMAYFYFVYQTEEKPTPLELKYIACEDANCAVSKEYPWGDNTPCDENGCIQRYFLTYQYDYIKIIVTFTDKIRESNVFTVNGFSATFRVVVQEDSLTVKEVFTFLHLHSIIFICFAGALVWTEGIELGAAAMFLKKQKIEKKFLIWVFVANLISLTLIWSLVNYIFMVNEITFFIVSELFAILFEAIFFKLLGKRFITSWKQAFLLSFLTNLASILIGFVLVGCFYLYNFTMY